MKYDVVSVFWNDHYYADRQPLPDTPDEFLTTPTLSVGVLLKETEASLLLASTLEPDHVDATYIVIIKSTVVAMKRHGKLNLEGIT